MIITFKLFILIYLGLLATQFNGLKKRLKAFKFPEHEPEIHVYIAILIVIIVTPAYDFITWIKNGFKPE